MVGLFYWWCSECLAKCSSASRRSSLGRGIGSPLTCNCAFIFFSISSKAMALEAVCRSRVRMTPPPWLAASTFTTTPRVGKCQFAFPALLGYIPVSPSGLLFSVRSLFNRRETGENHNQMAKKSTVARSNKPPKFKSRVVRRCFRCGRKRAFMRDFGMCRACFREAANEGLIPGVRKSSW